MTGDEEKISQEFYGIKVIGSYNEIESILKSYNPEEVIITISTRRFDMLRDVLETCEKMGVNVRINSDFFGHITKNVTVDNVFGLNIISFYPVRLSEWDSFIKRTIDILISLMLIIILSPFFCS